MPPPAIAGGGMFFPGIKDRVAAASSLADGLHGTACPDPAAGVQSRYESKTRTTGKTSPTLFGGPVLRGRRMRHRSRHAPGQPRVARGRTPATPRHRPDHRRNAAEGETPVSDLRIVDHLLYAKASSFSIHSLKCGHWARITFRPIFWLMRIPSVTLA